MDTGTVNPVAESEKQIEELTKTVAVLRATNSELNEVISRLKDMINRAYMDCVNIPEESRPKY